MARVTENENANFRIIVFVSKQITNLSKEIW